MSEHELNISENNNENKTDNNDNNEKNETIKKTEKKKEIKPRKRLITKNIQLFATAGVFLFFLVFLLGWKMFFDQSPLGAWNMVMDGEYIETKDIAEAMEDESDKDNIVAETGDLAYISRKYSQHASYEFDDSGVCKVTIGSATGEGIFDIASTEDFGNVISIAVSYGENPILYGTYKYNIEGNIFTGKKLVLENIDVENDVMELDKGKGKSPLKPFNDPVLDDDLVGTWYDTTNGISYKFTKKGEMYRIMSDTLTIKHYYTLLSENMFVARYVTDNEQTDTYTYYFDKEGNLFIDDYPMNKINE